MHSIIRANERAGMNYNKAIRFTELAITRGLRAEDLPCTERCYMESKASDPSFEAVLYNGFIFILKEEETCITMYPAPNWFFKKHHFDGKKQVRNIKKYLRYYDYGKEAA